MLGRLPAMRRGQLTITDILYYSFVCMALVIIINSVMNNQFAYDDLYERIEFLQNTVAQSQSRVEELSCSLQKIGTRGGFCLTKDSLNVGGNWIWDLNLTLALENLFEGKTVGDFGAGLGWYGRFFLRKNERWLDNAGKALEDENFFSNEAVMRNLKKPQRLKGWKGYDGAVFVERMTKGLVQFQDLSESIWLSEDFDWVMSLEVGEHIPVLYQENFIENLVRHAREGIVLSWAIPGQGGHHHVNEQTNQFVKNEFIIRGFEPDEKWETVLRKSAIFEWFKGTIMVFRKSEDKVKCKD